MSCYLDIRDIFSIFLFQDLCQKVFSAVFLVDPPTRMSVVGISLLETLADRLLNQIHGISLVLSSILDQFVDQLGETVLETCS